MALCNFCIRKETRYNRHFVLPFTCFECSNNGDYYVDTDKDDNEGNNNGDIIYVDSQGKNITINESTELCIISETDGASKNIPTQTEIDTSDFKDSLLASLYSQVEFLKQVIVEKDRQIEEGNMHIRAFLSGDINIYNVRARSNDVTISSDASTVDTSTSETSFNSNVNSSEFSYPDVSLQTVSRFPDDDYNYDGESKVTDEEIFLDLHQQFLQFQIMEAERKKEIENKMKTQLVEIRSLKHVEYEAQLNDDNNKAGENSFKIDRGLKPIPESSNLEFLHDDKSKDMNEVKPWLNGTCLVMGSSLLNGLKEQLMGPRFKVRPFPGALIEDFYNFAIPFIKKKPSSIILMAGSNDSVSKNKSSNSILEELLRLKSALQSKFQCNVILTYPSYRFDDKRANATLRNLRNYLLDLNIPVISNDNITDIHIGKRGLHLNERGSGKLAANYLSYMRRH